MRTLFDSRIYNYLISIVCLQTPRAWHLLYRLILAADQARIASRNSTHDLLCVLFHKLSNINTFRSGSMVLNEILCRQELQFTISSYGSTSETCYQIFPEKLGCRDRKGFASMDGALQMRPRQPAMGFGRHARAVGRQNTLAQDV